ncbi:MAG: beta-propeller domain-containing protein [Bdellovibrionales bacterium]
MKRLTDSRICAAIFAAVLSTLSTSPSPAQAKSIVYRGDPLPQQLIHFNTCEGLEKHVNEQFAKQNQYYYGRRGWLRKGMRSEGPPPPEPMVLEDAMLEQGNDMLVAQEGFALPASAAPKAESIGFAGKEAKAKSVVATNNQVDNVDEADFVKFNGRHIFQLHEGTLRILKAWPAREMNQIASLNITGQPIEMLVNDKHAVIMSNSGALLRISVIDISNPANPRELTQFELAGQYKTARLIGNTLRIVSLDYNPVQTLFEQRSEEEDNGWLQNPRVRRRLHIQPTVQIMGNQRRDMDLVKNCAQVWVPKEGAPQTLTRLVSIDLQAKSYKETLAFVRPDHVYVAMNNLYMAQQGWDYNNSDSQQPSALHKFSLGQEIEYQATGIVNGHLINQFAMDEHKGYLRVATNGSERTGKNFFGNGGQWKTVNRVQVLKQKGTALDVIGKTPNMAEGERLYSVRFDGEHGYVVTFRQVDPLFTLDLSRPRHPKVVGELKVPGFSTYIHMLDSQHLLTIGQDADENTGRPRGLKLSVFDVKDFAKPKEVKSLIFKSNVSSESSYEHKAFSFYREKGILAIPAAQAGTKSALLLFKVTTQDIKSAGEVTMTDLFPNLNNNATVRRSFFADNVVYAIGGQGIRAAQIDNPKTPLATVLFDNQVAEFSW